MTAVAVVRTEVALPFPVGTVAWHPSGQWLVVGASGSSGGVARIDAATGSLRWHVFVDRGMTSVAVRADGRIAVSESTGRVKLLVGATGDTIFDLAGTGEVLYSPDGRFLVHDTSSAHVALVDAACFTPTPRALGH